MCELFGVSGSRTINVDPYLSEFLSHSREHKNGWGIAQFYGNAVSLEKEPVAAWKSLYIRERLRHRFEAKNMMAHIRLATCGEEKYENCHPFVQRDVTDRVWTLIHNGTIFDCEALNKYSYVQEGRTDSERILCYIIDEIDRRTSELGRALNDRERFDVVDRVILEITPRNNKVNLILYDSSQFYVHTNMKNTLFQRYFEGTRFFSTVPLDDAPWEPVPFMQLVSYREGLPLYAGTVHGNEYIYNADAMKYIYLDAAGL